MHLSLVPGEKIEAPAQPLSVRRQSQHTVMHFLENAGLIFLTDQLTNDRYLVDTGATLSIVPLASNAGPSSPLLTGADGQLIPSWGFV